MQSSQRNSTHNGPAHPALPACLGLGSLARASVPMWPPSPAREGRISATSRSSP